MKMYSGAIRVLSIMALGMTASLTEAQVATQSGLSSSTKATTSSEQELTEIVVTAEKRPADLEHTAIAMSVVGTAELQSRHLVGLTDLNGVVPGVQIYPVLNSTQVSVRGLGSTFLDPRGQPGVASSLDGLYFAQPTSNGGGFFDIARIEILKGPQGTLEGRNAAAGAINIITNRPDVDNFEASAAVTAGNYGLWSTEGMINIPVSDRLAFRAAFQTIDHEGYVGHIYNDAKDAYGRVEALWTPLDNLTIFNELNYNHAGGYGVSPEYHPFAGISPWTLDSPIPGLSIPTVGTQDNATWNDQLHVDYDWDFATLTSITGFVHQQNEVLTPDGVYFNALTVNNLKDWTQELRLASKTKADHAGGLQWLVGLYYLNEESFYHYEFPLGIIALPHLPATSESGFGQVSYGLTDTLRLTAGVRYTEDKKKATYEDGTRRSVSFNNTSYKVGAEWDVAPKSLLYANVATGYVPGGLNAGSPGQPTAPSQYAPTFDSETNTAYEIGSKNRFLANRLQLNADVYLYNFKNYQYQSIAYPNSGPFTPGIVNIGDVKTYGAELDAIFLLTPSDKLSVSTEWAHGEFNSISYPSLIFAPPFTAFVFAPQGKQPLINLPDAGLYLGYSHTWTINDRSSLEMQGNSHYSAAYPVVAGSSDPNDRQRSYWMSDATITYSYSKWQVEAWVRNIENSAVNVYGEGPGLYLYQILPPRTFGLTVRVRLGGP
jgi:iron complex outermembrane receptor protein